MRTTLYRLSTASLVCIFLVVLAGSIVRMTGSGMGCPDWPKCFGYYIPPTSVSTLTWTANRSFQRGNIIIKDQSLWVARYDFVSGESYNPDQWEPYTEHDYALFNPLHTWVEYINRLIGALTGIPVLLLFVLSIAHVKRDPLTTIMAFTGLVLLAFEAWLGKLVVDGNLVPHQITWHLLGAVALVLVYTFLVMRTKPSDYVFKARRNKRIVLVGLLSLVLLLVQVFLGTTVREAVDEAGKAILLADPNWVEQLPLSFKIHRSFSLVVLACTGYFCMLVIHTRSISTLPRVLLATLLLEVLAGVGLAYLDLPALLQPLHLFLAMLDVALVAAILLAYQRKTEPISA